MYDPKADFSGLLPDAVRHVEQYPPETLDARTVRNLYRALQRWLDGRDAIADSIEDKDSRRVWLEFFAANSGMVQTTLNKLKPYYIP